MMINDAMISGARTVQASTERLSRAAHEIATQPIRPLDAIGQPSAGQQEGTNRAMQKPDWVEPLIEQNQALYQGQAGVVVMKAANSNLGELLNMFA
jgi:hypothetical protein